MTTAQLQKLSEEFGSAFYLLSTAQFKQNFTELKSTFKNIYPNTNIAYSYKTNYIPTLCRAVDSLCRSGVGYGIGHRPENWRCP